MINNCDKYLLLHFKFLNFKTLLFILFKKIFYYKFKKYTDIYMKYNKNYGYITNYIYLALFKS